MRKIFIASLAAGLLLGGAVFPASALTSSEVQAEIQRLVQRIAELTVQLNALSGGGVATSSLGAPNLSSVSVSMPPGRHRICNILRRNLGIGAQGDDVHILQSFLHEQNMLDVPPTGYFGERTSDAVRRWQIAEGMQAAGTFGPLSRDRLKNWCGGWLDQVRLSANPVRGDAPLTVTFNTWLSGFRRYGISYVIEYGDGTSEHATNCPAPTDYCTGPGQNTHTYKENGTFTAVLYKDDAGGCGPDADPGCLGPPASRMMVAKLQINVGPIACTMEYMPVCGAKPIVCVTTPCNPIPTTYSNKCKMAADGATLLYEGRCLTPSDNEAPVISSLSGSTTLAVGATGTWTIQASDPENQTLSYSVSWGDAPVGSLGSNAAAAPSFVQTTTFTHSYSAVGTYTVRIIVRDSGGMTAEAATTVGVVGPPAATCAAGSVPVCGSLSCVPSIGVGYGGANCSRPTIQKTFSDRCALNAAGATYLYDGACSSGSGISCITPYENVTVTDGSAVSSQPYFTSGSYYLGAAVSQMRCSNGSWLACDSSGNNCR